MRINPSILLASCLATLLAEACSGTVEPPLVTTLQVPAHDATLHARLTGDRKAAHILIAVHGGPGLSSDYMGSLEQLHSADIAVVTYDQRGTGQSTAGGGDFSLDRHVADLEAVRQAIDADNIHVFGHSWGGVVAQRYATLYPNRLRSLILMGSGPPRKAAVDVGQENLGQRIAALQEQDVIPSDLAGSTDQVLRAIMPAYFSDPHFAMPDELRSMSFDQKVYDSTHADTGDWDFVEELGRLEQPVLFLWGKDDPFGPDMASATREALKSAPIDFMELAACGHYWHECPEAFYARLRTFLSEQIPP